ncbi:MAG: NTP transferase domain-containing protein [Verrucomicrobia bacterium]|nr:NTP transferase domain-containing protein [Verrucomicrobiota bacterium]MBU4428258.1 NTP transferase domain-containing protein [Verrucomicrobiota bacterium]MCG2679557.1 NTP transferase domain-containing protein [Kiritimatiellia bacterium]
MGKIEKAVILAGGRGERLRPLTDELPKPMAPVHGVPFTDYLLRSLVDAGIMRVLFLVGYKAEKIMAYYGDCLACGVQIEYSVGTEEDLTGRRLLNAYEKLSDRFLLLYGDNYWPIPMEKMTANYERLGLPVTTTVFSNKKGTGEYGHENNVIVDASGRVGAYDKTRRAPGLNGIDIGFFIVEKKVLDVSETGNISFEKKILAQLAAEGRLGAFMTDEQYYFITSLDSLRNFEAVTLSKGFQKLEQKDIR